VQVSPAAAIGQVIGLRLDTVGASSVVHPAQTDCLITVTAGEGGGGL
jgi:hypothetical protein